MFPDEEVVEELHQSFDRLGSVAEGAAFEVSSLGGFRAHAGSGEIRGAEEGAFPIGDDALHVIARTEDSFESIRADQIREPVKIFAKTGTGFLCVDKANLNAIVDKVVEEGKESIEAFPAGALDVKILDIRGRDPEKATRGGNQVMEQCFVNLFVQ